MQDKEEILSNEEKMTDKENEKKLWREAFFGTEIDVIHFISMLTIDPGLVVLFVYYISAKTLNIPLTYVVVDALIVWGWWRKAVKRKKWIEEERDVDRTDIIRQKIQELKESEENAQNQK